MIVGIGIDATEIDRFIDFRAYSKKSLERTFSSAEIDYCLEHEVKSAERFAARFAAKEAFFKAFCAAFPARLLQSDQVFRQVSIEHKKNGHVNLIVDWKGVLNVLDIPEAHISITHTKTVATAIVILEKS